MVAKLDRLGLAVLRVEVLARLHDRRVQVEVVRHHGGPEDADGDVEHVAVAQDLRRRDESKGDRPPAPASTATARSANDPAISTISAMTSASTYRKPLCCRNSTTSTSSAVRQTPQINGSPNSRFRAMAAPMTSARSQAAIAISHRIHSAMRRWARVGVAARLREIPAAGDSQTQRQRLQQDRHEVRQHDHAEQRVAISSAARQVGRPVSRVHVADGDQIPGTGERQHLAPESGPGRDGDRSMNLGKTDAALGKPPPSGRVGFCGFGRHRLLF